MITRFVTTRGARLWVGESGLSDAPAILLSNSLGTTHRMWNTVASILSDRFRVIRYDTRGHGASSSNAMHFQIGDLARDVIGILDDMNIDKVHFAGLSLGGMTGQFLAAVYPHRLASLSLLATTAFMPPASSWLDRAALVRREGTRAILPATLSRWFTPDALQSRAPDVQGVADDFAAISREGYAGCCEAIARMDLRESLPKVSVATLIIAGANDPATPPSMSEAMHASIQGSRLILLEPAAHLLAVEQPEAVAHHLGDHVSLYAGRGV